MKKKYFEMILKGVLIFILSGMFFRFVGGMLFNKKEKTNLDEMVFIKKPKINETTVEELYLDIKSLERRTENLNGDFIGGKKTFKQNAKKYRSLTKKYLEIRLRLGYVKGQLDLNKEDNKKKMKGVSEKKLGEMKSKLEKIKESLDLLKEDVELETEISQNYILNMMTVVETIFLPLGVLTGYFGMNFSAMGGHVGADHKADTRGILGWRYGQHLVWVISVVMAGTLLYAMKSSKVGLDLGLGEGFEVQSYNWQEKEYHGI